MRITAQLLLLHLLFCWVMNNYKHLARVERIEIGILLRKGYSAPEIAVEVGRHPSTIYREMRRNADEHDIRGEYGNARGERKGKKDRKKRDHD